MHLQYYLRLLPATGSAPAKKWPRIEKQTRYAAELYNVDVRKYSSFGGPVLPERPEPISIFITNMNEITYVIRDVAGWWAE